MSFDLAPTFENPLWPILVAVALVVIHFARRQNDTTPTDTSLATILSLLGKSKIPIVGASTAYLLSNTNLLNSLKELWNKLAGKPPENPPTNKEPHK